MDNIIKNKRGLELVAIRSWSHEISSEKFIHSLYIIWPSLMMQCNVFELFQKLHLQIYACQFMASWIIPLPFVLLNLEIVEEKGKITKNWISQEQKELFGSNKKHFSQFLKDYHLVKNKNLMKNSGHKL